MFLATTQGCHNVKTLTITMIFEIKYKHIRSFQKYTLHATFIHVNGFILVHIQLKAYKSYNYLLRLDIPFS